MLCVVVHEKFKIFNLKPLEKPKGHREIIQNNYRIVTVQDRLKICRA